MFGKRFRDHSPSRPAVIPSNPLADNPILKSALLTPDSSLHLDDASKCPYSLSSIPLSPNVSTTNAHASFDIQHRLLPPFQLSSSIRSSSSPPDSPSRDLPPISPEPTSQSRSPDTDDPIQSDLGTPNTETTELTDRPSEPRFELEYRLPPASPLSILDINLYSCGSSGSSNQLPIRRKSDSIKSERFRQSLPSLPLLATMDSTASPLARSQSSQDCRQTAFMASTHGDYDQPNRHPPNLRATCSSRPGQSDSLPGSPVDRTSPNNLPVVSVAPNLVRSLSEPHSPLGLVPPSDSVHDPAYSITGPESSGLSSQLHTGPSDPNEQGRHPLPSSLQGVRRSLIPFHSGDQESGQRGGPQDLIPSIGPTHTSPTRASRRVRSLSQTNSEPLLSGCPLQRTYTPPFSSANKNHGESIRSQLSSRPCSTISRSSTSSIFQRIRAGMSTYKIGGNPLTGSHHLFGSGDHDTHRLEDVENLKSPQQSSSFDSREFVEPVEPRKKGSVSSLNRSHSDSITQSRTALDELRSVESSHPHRLQRALAPSPSLTAIGSSTSSCFSNLPATSSSSDPSQVDAQQKSSAILSPLTTGSTSARKHSKETSVAPSTKKNEKSKILPRLDEDETEEAYLIRLGEVVEKSKIPSVLASSNQPFHAAALIKYMSLFEFSHDPIDLSIRKLLMVIDLPPETQQIDRVIESFAKRYTECNPKLFYSHDQVYILAFSIIMLHTDAFNKSNKAKMSRADYVKNTKMDGIPSELLEYIYDNVTYTPFINVDGTKEFVGQKQTHPPPSSNDYSVSSIFALAGHNSLYGSSNPVSGSILPSTKDHKSKIDPYQLIAKGSTHELRPDLGSSIPSRNPFSFTGSVNWFDFKRLRDSFGPKKSVLLQIVNLFPSKANSIFKQIEPEDQLVTFNSSHNYPGPHQNPSNPSSNVCHTPQPSASKTGEESVEASEAIVTDLSSRPLTSDAGVLNLRAIKVGLIQMKHDIPSTTLASLVNQSSSSTQRSLANELSLTRNVVTKKWKSFCVLLTVGQLIFMKDVGLVDDLKESVAQAAIRNQCDPDDQLVVRITGLKPDLVFQLDNTIALMDLTYHRRPCTFSFALSKDLTVLMGVDDHDDMNSWITHINYAAAYKTSKVPMGCFYFNPSSGPSLPGSPDSKSKALDRTFSVNHVRGSRALSSNGRSSFESKSRLSHDDPLPFSSSTSIFQVAGHSPILDDTRSSSTFSQRRPFNLPSIPTSTYRDLAKFQIGHLETQIVTAKNALNEDLRLARNLAVLTPFQFSTRSRLQQAILPVAERVRSSRCILSKLVCYREILVRDLGAIQSSSHGSVKPSPYGLKTQYSDYPTAEAVLRNDVVRSNSSLVAGSSKASLGGRPLEQLDHRNSVRGKEIENHDGRRDPSILTNADRIQQIRSDHRRSTSSCSQSPRLMPTPPLEDPWNRKSKRFSEALLSLGASNKAQDGSAAGRRCSKDLSGIGVRLSSGCGSAMVTDTTGTDVIPVTSFASSSSRPLNHSTPRPLPDSPSDDESDEIFKVTATLRKVGRLQMDVESIAAHDNPPRLTSSTVGTTKSLSAKSKSYQSQISVRPTPSGTPRSLSKLPKGFLLSTRRPSISKCHQSCSLGIDDSQKDFTSNQSGRNSPNLSSLTLRSPYPEKDHGRERDISIPSIQRPKTTLPQIASPRVPTTTSPTSLTREGSTSLVNELPNDSAKARMLTKSKLASNRNQECRAFAQRSPPFQRFFPQLPTAAHSPSLLSKSARKSTLSLGHHHDQQLNSSQVGRSKDENPLGLAFARPRSSTSSQSSSQHCQPFNSNHQAPSPPSHHHHHHPHQKRFTQALGLP